MMAPAGPLEYNRSWYKPCSYGIRTELEATSRINRHLSDVALRNIALSENYFRPLALQYEAPLVYSNGTRTCCS